ncbi:MAG: divergent PAP2 family protein [Clostridiales bacterium]|nr:divergent PAP2 family protein [Clostridiales bacterium]MBO4580464.1 divergent PAP2 family protein [Clostridiales bacterium]
MTIGEFFAELIGNKILIAGVLAWFIAQVFKCINNVITEGKFSIERLFGDGGMPSGHSATVSSVATMTGLVCGVGSVMFAIAAILAIIVMHDAMGVRLQTGIQAKKINDLTLRLDRMFNMNVTGEEKLKELIGHTPLQVVAGFALGVVVAVIYYVVTNNV